MSVRSFLSSFFGERRRYEPDGPVVALVTLKSCAGVLLITVSIGAYIRKLLR